MLLPRLPWDSHIEAQGSNIACERQKGRTASQENSTKGEAAMTYKRGKVYWYKFRWTIKGADGTKQNYTFAKQHALQI
jgi:hypothetical protein